MTKENDIEEDGWHEEILADPDADQTIQLQAVKDAIADGVSEDDAWELYGHGYEHLRKGPA